LIVIAAKTRPTDSSNPLSAPAAFYELGSITNMKRLASPNSPVSMSIMHQISRDARREIPNIVLIGEIPINSLGPSSIVATSSILKIILKYVYFTQNEQQPA
jgi:uncharacterized membrane protein